MSNASNALPIDVPPMALPDRSPVGFSRMTCKFDKSGEAFALVDRLKSSGRPYDMTIDRGRTHGPFIPARWVVKFDARLGGIDDETGAIRLTL